MERPLTAREAKFVELWLKYGNGARAAREAGYSVHTARVIACELLRKPPIHDAIEAALQKQSRTPVRLEGAKIYDL